MSLTLLGAGSSSSSSGAGDTTRPTLVSATIAADGVTLTTVWSEVVTQGSSSWTSLGATFDGDEVYSFTNPTGGGTTTLTSTFSPVVRAGETHTFGLTANGVKDAANNGNLAISGASVTNNSEQAAWSLITSVAAGSTNTTNITTGSVNTTGANLIVVSTAINNGATATLTDSKGNTWTGLTSTDAGGNYAKTKLFYCYSPVVGSGHTFTLSAAGGYPAIAVVAYSGAIASPFDVQSYTNGGNGDVQPGSVTPTTNNQLLVTGFAFSTSVTASINSGFTVQAQVAALPGTSYSCAIATLVQTTAAAINPTWSATSGGQNRSASIATFKS